MGSRDSGAAIRDSSAGRIAMGRIVGACVMGWLVPGGGHWLLGRRRRAVVFFVLVTVCFALGAALDGRFSVVDRRAPLLSSLQVVACLGSGPMEILSRSAVYGSPTYRMPEADSLDPNESRPPTTRIGILLRSRNEAIDSAYGTAYLWTAGLMNLLLLLDVFDIGVGRKD